MADESRGQFTFPVSVPVRSCTCLASFSLYSHLSHALRSGPGGNLWQIARCTVTSAARRMAFSSMLVSVIQPAAGVTTEFRV